MFFIKLEKNNPSYINKKKASDCRQSPEHYALALLPFPVTVTVTGDVPYMYSAQVMSNTSPDHAQWVALMNALQKYGTDRVSWDIFL